MVKFFRITEKARKLSRQQKHDQALAEYRTAIALAEREGDAAGLRNLYNAAGDAALQKSDTHTAVEYFEKAADSYLEEGLYDNAIALCHKLLRYVPTRAGVYARLGRIYGEKGLRNESLQNWLEYAERREKAGDLEGVTVALRAAVALSPERETLRQQLAEALLAQGQSRGALAELEELVRRAELAGRTDRAGELGRRIEALRRELAIEEPASASSGAGPESGSGLMPGSDSQPEAGGGLAVEHFGILPDLGAESSSGAEPLVAEGRTRHDLETAAQDPTFGFSLAAPTLTPPQAPAVSPPAGPTLEPSTAAASSFEDFARAEPETVPLDLAPIPYVPVGERIARAAARLAEDPTNAEERIYLAELYQESGELDRACAAMEQGARELYQAGQHELSFRAYRRLAGLAPDQLEPVQKLVEVAQSTGSRDLLLQSYELLADRLMQAGQYGRAAAMHRRVLEIDPDQRHSQDQLLILEGLDTVPAAEVGGGVGSLGGLSSEEAEGYVNLGNLIAEDMVSRAADPRMVSRARPTGDEEADLRTPIDVFRSGVVQNIEESDFESHYDLGVAFRDMGLVDEAIREFQLAARGDDHRERAFELMGLCFMEKKMVSVAANCFRRGIESGRDPYAVLGLHYHLARSLEELGDLAAARAEYEKVMALDVQFLDAAERLKKLP